jgi:hypothetical protein
MKYLLIIALLFSSCSVVKIENNSPIPKDATETEVIQQKELVFHGKELLNKFKDETLKLKKNSIVFAPEKSSLQKFYIDEKTPLIFASHKLIKINKTSSILQDRFGEEFEVENALIIPTDRNVQKGDFVITQYPKGRSFAIGLVIESEIKGKIKIKYINPTIETNETYLDENTYIKIKDSFNKGSILIVKDGENFLREMLLCDCNGFVLTINDKAIVNVRNKQHTTPVDIYYDYKEGEDLFFNHNGKFLPGTIKSLNQEEKTANILYKEKSKNQETTVSLVALTKNLD